LVKFADSSNQPAQIRAATLHAACYPACYLRAAWKTKNHARSNARYLAAAARCAGIANERSERRPRMARYENILATIGNTPIVKLQKLAPPGVNVYVKIESFNPMGSVKDRMARAVIERAEANGELRPGQTVIEATSGNTGIGLAMVCAQKGYPLVVTMAENFSVERRKLLRFLGAKVVLTPASEKGSGMLNKAIELAERHGYYLCRQFENEANADTHSATTAQEILRDFEGERLDYFVTTFGTGGTLKGVSRALKAARSDTKVVAAEPDNAQVLGSGIPQPTDENGKARGSHPNFRPHVVQGTSPDFVAKLTGDAVAPGWVDEVVPVDGADALRLARELATREGILVGISSGAALAAAITVARRSPVRHQHRLHAARHGRTLSVDGAVRARRRAHECGRTRAVELDAGLPLQTQPSLGAATGARPAPSRSRSTSDAQRFVDDTVAAEPVVMFALQWCEFCWAVRKFFDAIGVPFTASTSTRSNISAANAVRRSARAAQRTGEATIHRSSSAAGWSADATLCSSRTPTATRARCSGSRRGQRVAEGRSVRFLPKWQQPRQAANGERR
jgi:cysteine synthase A